MKIITPGQQAQRWSTQNKKRFTSWQLAGKWQTATKSKRGHQGFGAQMFRLALVFQALVQERELCT
jgi:hypothetical protein